MKTKIMFCVLGILWSRYSHNSVGQTHNPAGNTAQSKLTTIDSMAVSYGRGLRFVGVQSSNVRIDGTSDKWQYAYKDTLIPSTCYWFHSDSIGVAFDSSTQFGASGGVITQTWFNSDSAMYFAEKTYGSHFRTANPRYSIFAGIDQPMPNSILWFVSYRSMTDNTRMLLSIDARTGAVGVAITDYMKLPK